MQATGGGGGIGIYICRSHEEVVSQYSVASRQGKANFGDAGAGLFSLRIYGVGQGMDDARLTLCRQHLCTESKPAADKGPSMTYR